MQGVIHNCSRIRATMRRSRPPQPIYALDLAVAFTYRAIPQRDFEQVVINQIPLCSRNDFDQARPLYPDEIEKVLKRLAEGEVDSLENSGERRTGIVISYEPSKFGVIDLEDGQSKAIFFANQVDEKQRDFVRPGDRVAFYLALSEQGGKATIVEIVERAELSIISADKATGTVKSFQADKFGFIEVDDGGPDAFFWHNHVTNVDFRRTLKVGDRILFELRTNAQGRQAKNLESISI